MRLKSVTIEGFRGFIDRAEIDLSADVVILHGPNGSGKTSLLDAILWAVTGRIERFGDKARPVSVYSREGIARVELALHNGRDEIVIVRAADDERHTLRLHVNGEVTNAATAERRLAGLLLPHLQDRSESATTLSKIITRGAYLQQDVVRQFVESDTPTQRFGVLSEVIGAGVILDLQQTLEKSRNQWSRSTSALKRETAEPLREKLDQITEQLSRLEGDTAVAAVDARAASERFFTEAQRLLGSRSPSLSGAPTSSTGLDRLLKEISAERSQIERGLASSMALVEEVSVLRDPGSKMHEEISHLRRSEQQLVKELEDLDQSIGRWLAEAARLREQELHDQNRRNRAASLAKLALEGLGDICPVCQQKHDVQKTRAHLEDLITASSKAPEGGFDAEGRAEELNAQRSEVRVRLDLLRSRIADLDGEHSSLIARQDVIRGRLRDIGINIDSDVEAALRQRTERLREHLASVSALLRSGEQLTLSIVRLGEQRRRAELLEERVSISARLNAALEQVAAQERTHALASRIIEGLRDASLEVTKKQIESVAPIFQRIYSRIDPHPTFRVTQVAAAMERGRGQLRVGVSDPDQGDSYHDPLPVLSSSQLNSFAVSLFLSLNLALPSLRLDITMLDDPLQSLDSINLLGLVDVLRRLKESRQVVVSTHEPRLLGLLQRKLRPVREAERMLTIAFDAWTRAGPSYRIVPQGYAATDDRVLAA